VKIWPQTAGVPFLQFRVSSFRFPLLRAAPLLLQLHAAIFGPAFNEFALFCALRITALQTALLM
jgi:hypothetical protein